MLKIDLNNLPRKNDKVSLTLRGAKFDMIVNDARIRYGQVDVELTPVSGTGTFWVRYDSVNHADATPLVS